MSGRRSSTRAMHATSSPHPDATGRSARERRIVSEFPLATRGAQMEFNDRYEAGRVLASALEAWRGQSDLVVLALPRGGVPVAWEVAQGLQAALDVLVVRKLGFPGQEELAMGAIGPG